MSHPISLAARRLQNLGHLKGTEVERELEILTREIEGWPEGEPFNDHMKKVLDRYRQILARVGGRRAEFGVLVFDLIEAAWIDEDEAAKAALDDFLGRE